MGIRLPESVTPELQQKNDRRLSLLTIAAFFAVVLCYVYLFTNVASQLGLPAPQHVAGSAAALIGYEFDDDGNVDSWLYMQSCNFRTNDDERLVLFSVITGAFLCGYFLPLRWKRPSYVFWFLAGFGVMYGTDATLMLLLSHLTVYMAFHGPFQKRDLAGFAFATLFVLPSLLVAPSAVNLLWAMLYAAIGIGFINGVLYPVLRRDFVSVRLIKNLVIHFPLLVIFSGAMSEGVSGNQWAFPMGMVFFLFQWARLITYHIDYKEGQVPKDLGVLDYLSVFLSPGAIPNYAYAPYAGQGYSYVSNRFLCKDKNQIIGGGLKLWGLALMYLVFADWIVERFVDFMEDVVGIPVYEFIGQMVRDYIDGTPMSTPTVLVSTILDQARIFLIYGAVLHFKIGTWRVLGYNMDPQYNRPWLATNLVSLWGRFAFHYREFLMRAVYYPVFFRFFKTRITLRVFTAIMVATVLGNPLWGHTPTKLLTWGLSWEHFFLLIVRSWPYYVLLGLGISLTQLYLLKKVRRRKPWTLDRWLPMDVLAAYLTIQYFCLIHVFIRPQEDSTLWDHVRLFLIGLGIHV